MQVSLRRSMNAWDSRQMHESWKFWKYNTHSLLCFFIKVYLYSEEVFLTAMLFINLKQVKEVRILCVISTMIIRKIQNKTVVNYTSCVFITNFNFATVSHFSLRNSKPLWKYIVYETILIFLTDLVKSDNRLKDHMIDYTNFIKCPPSTQRQILPIENSLKMKNLFYFILKAQFILKTFTFLPCFFGYVEKQLDKKCCG